MNNLFVEKNNELDCKFFFKNMVIILNNILI